MARDATWYTISLVTLAVFFSNGAADAAADAAAAGGGKITAPEAGIQFGLYIGYALIMYRSKGIEKWFYATFYAKKADKKKAKELREQSSTVKHTKSFFGPSRRASTTPGAWDGEQGSRSGGGGGGGGGDDLADVGDVQLVVRDDDNVDDSDEGGDGTAKAAAAAAAVAAAPPTSPGGASVASTVLGDGVEDEYAFTFFEGGYFRTNFYRLITQQRNFEDAIAYHAVSQIPGDVKQTFDALDEEKNGCIETQNVRHLLKALGDSNTDADVARYMAELDTDQSGDISFAEFKAWYVTSESRFRAEMSNRFDEVDVDGSGDIDRGELRALLTKLHHGADPSEEEARKP